MVEAFAAVTIELGHLDTARAKGGLVDADEHARLVSSLIRLASKLGVDRRTVRDVAPGVAECLEKDE